MPTVARDLMVPDPLTISATTPFPEIQHLFVVAGIYGAPVVDPRGAVVGVISAIDLLRVSDQMCDEEWDEGEAPDQSPPGITLTAADIASPDTVWVSPETPVDRVAELMQRERIHRVLVGEGGHLAGILTTFDLLRAVPISSILGSGDA